MNDLVPAATITKDLTISDLLSLLWNGRLVVFITIILCLGHAFYIAFTMPELYRSSATLITYQPLSTRSETARGVLASNLLAPSARPSSLTQHRLVHQKFRSQDFILSFVSKYQLLPALFFDSEAVNKKGADLRISPLDLFLTETSQVIDRSHDQINKEFLRRLVIKSDYDKGIMEVSFDHESSLAAMELLSLLIAEMEAQVNAEMVVETKKISRKLEEQLEKATDVNLRLSITKTLEYQRAAESLVPALGYFPFIYTSRPFKPESRISPNRTFIVGRGLVVGTVLSVVLLLLFRAIDVRDTFH